MRQGGLSAGCAICLPPGNRTSCWNRNAGAVWTFRFAGKAGSAVPAVSLRDSLAVEGSGTDAGHSARPGHRGAAQPALEPVRPLPAFAEENSVPPLSSRAGRVLSPGKLRTVQLSAMKSAVGLPMTKEETCSNRGAARKATGYANFFLQICGKLIPAAISVSLSLQGVSFTGKQSHNRRN